MLLWLLCSYIVVSAGISCFAGNHKFLHETSLNKHECPERSACFVHIYANSNDTHTGNTTNISEMDAHVERGCLEEAEVPLFHNQASPMTNDEG